MNLPDISYFWPEWQITGYLGRTAYCFNYLAESTLDGNTVYSNIKVIKMPQKSEYINEIYKNGVSPDKLTAYFAQFKDRLNWEMRIFRSSSSPHIMQIDDMRIVDDKLNPGWTAYIRCGLFTPLSEYVSQIDFDQSEVLRLGRELCKALMICSRSGMLHGHVNPENIYVMDDGRFVLSDFGLRRCLESAGNLLFTKPDSTFDAPEVSESKQYTEESDIYSLGKIMRFLLRTAEVREIGNPEDKVDSGLVETIETAMAEKPEERFQNAATMLANLNSLNIEGKEFARRAAASALAKAKAYEYENHPGGFDPEADEYRDPSELMFELIEKADSQKERKPQKQQEEKKGFFAKIKSVFRGKGE